MSRRIVRHPVAFSKDSGKAWYARLTSLVTVATLSDLAAI